LEDRRNVEESSCNFGDGTDQRVQSLMFMMMMMIMMMMMMTLADFSLPPRCKWDLRCSGVVTQCRLVATDVSELSVVPSSMIKQTT